MDNILINFTADPAGLAPGIEGLEQLKVSDQELAASIAKTTAAETARNKAMSDGAKASKKDVEGLTTSFNNLSKINLGAAFNKSLADIRSTLKLTDDQLKVFYTNIKTQSQQEILKGGTTEELAALKQLIQSADEALTELGTTSETTGNKTQSLRVQLRQVRDELQVMEQAGLEGSEAFEQLQIHAGHLSDQVQDTAQRIKGLSSDTFVFDALLSGITGVTGAFTAAQGAVTLFGDDNKDLQQAMLKLYASMNLLQGVQAVVNVLQKQSAASIAIDLILRRNQAAATTAQAAAETELAAATEGATLATTALDAAMAVNPAVILVAAIAALASGLYYFATRSNDASEATVRLTKSLKDQYDLTKEISDLQKHQYDQVVLRMQADIDEANANKTSKGAILEMELALAKVKNDQAIKDALNVKNQVTGVNSLAKVVTRFDGQLRVLPQIKLTGNETTADLDALIKKLDATSQKLIILKNSAKADDQKNQIEVLSNSTDLLKKKIEDLKKTQEDVITSQAAVETKSNEIVQYTYDQQIKSATAAVEARVALAKKGSKEELDAQIAAIQAQVKAATDPKLNPDLTSGERLRIIAEGKRQEADLNNAFDVKALQDIKTGIDAQVLLTKEGSKEEYDLKLQSLKAGEVAELASNTLTDNQRRDIQNRYYHDAQELARSFFKKVSEDSLNSDIADTNAQIYKLEVDGATQTNDQLFDLKKKLISDQAELEIVAIRASTDNETLKAAKIKEVYAKELLDKQELEKQKREAEINANRDSKIEAIQTEIDKTNSIVQASGAGEAVIRAQHQQTLENTKAIARQEEIRNTELLANKTITQQQYDEAKRANDKKVADDEIQVEIDKIQKKLEIEDSAADHLKQIGDLIFDNSKVKYQQELDQDQQLYDNKLITQNEFNNRKADIAKREANAQKEKAIFDIAVELAKAIFKVEAQASVLLLEAPELAAVAEAQIPLLIGEAAFQSALVLAKKYKTGGFVDGPGTGTSDSVPAWLSAGEYVTTAAMTNKHQPALEAINKDRFQDYLVMHEMPKRWKDQYEMPIIPKGLEDKARTLREPAGIDYDRLGNVVAEKLSTELAKQLATNPHVSINLDETGFVKSIQKGLQTIIIKNKRLNF